MFVDNLPRRMRQVWHSRSNLDHGLAHPTIGSLALLPKGAYLGTGKHSSNVRVLKNSAIVASCYVDVHMLSYSDGQTYDHTHNDSLIATRQASHINDKR